MWKAVRAYALWTNESFKVPVSGKRKLERNRSAGFGLEPNCEEMQEYYIIAREKLKAVIEQTNITTLQPRHEFRYFYHSEVQNPFSH